ncbi:HPr family phosphocarrier protein [Caldisericum sp.]|jgi:phosphotransferase system HPr (HPr) family protein|uniref:HPr family phosphocarrier protein n=1 Tax=Caldisericum sp. TaxID=2499687 RepID=UPI003D0C4286
MKTQSFVIKNKVGLHARPAAVLVQAANKFKSEIKLEKDGNEVSAKSILGVLSLGAEKGTVVVVTANGVDEEEALKTIEELVNNNFGDPE